jgi:nitrogen regulatory protein P-II 1
MKQIIAIVKPFLAEKVLESLRLAPLESLYVREVKGYGRQKNSLDRYGDSEFSMAFLPKVEITMWVDDHRAEEIVRKIEKVARTGRIGDGKIMVLSGTEPETPLSDLESAAVAKPSGRAPKNKR